MPSVTRTLSKWTQQEIQYLFDHAVIAYKSKELTILVAPSLFMHGRVLLTTPKKIGGAPVRNKLRRRVKSIFYEQKLYTYNKDIAFLTKPGIHTLTFEKLESILTKAIKDTHVAPSNS